MSLPLDPAAVGAETALSAHEDPRIADPRRGAGRFAPSPSGSLHLGNLRTALAAWAWARSTGDAFLMRIDDLDPDRSRPDHEAQQLQDLAAIGIDWDGAMLRQSARASVYQSAITSLLARDLGYPCFCTRAEIRAAATAPHGDQPDGAYPGTCAHLSADEAIRRIELGEEHALRARTNNTTRSFEDAVLGTVEAQLDDFVIRRKDSVAAYNLATVIDDHESGVTQVVRGADLATTTPRQIWLIEALQLRGPEYAHIPLVVGPDAQPLSKRHGSVTLDELAAEGWQPAEIRAKLMRSLGAPTDVDHDDDSDASWFAPAEIPLDPWVWHDLMSS